MEKVADISEQHVIYFELYKINEFEFPVYSLLGLNHV